MKKALKVLLLRRNTGIYGADRVILILASHLKKMGHRPVVGIINDRRNPCNMLFDKANDEKLETLQFISNKRLDFNTIRQIREYCWKQNIDIVHSHGFKADILGFLAVHYLTIPIIATKHGWTHGNWIIRIWESVDLVFLHFFDRIVAVSDQIEKTLIQKRIPVKKIEKIYNGIELDWPIVNQKQIQQSLLLDGKQVIGIVGRLSVEKGHEVLIRSFSQIVPQKPNAILLVIGDGPLMDDLKVLVGRLKLEKQVLFTGFRNDMIQLYSIIDILVSSSFREGIPMNLLEAMAMRKPIIATKVGGVPQLIQHNRTGILIDPGNCDQLRDSIIHLLEDPDKCEYLSKNAYRTVEEKFSGKRMAEHYLDLYASLI